MPRNKRLFKPDETYTNAASELYDRVSELAAELLEEYRDYPTRDIVVIVRDAFEFQSVFTRIERQLKASKVPDHQEED
jgi:hypothetical protein